MPLNQSSSKGQGVTVTNSEYAFEQWVSLDAANDPKVWAHVQDVALATLRGMATFDKVTLDESTFREVERRGLVWVEDGNEDEWGNTTGFHAPIGSVLAPWPDAEPEMFVIRWTARSTP